MTRRSAGRPRKDASRIPGEKPCTRCGISQDFAEFYKNSSTTDGLASWCSSCQREHYRETYKKEQARKEQAGKEGPKQCSGEGCITNVRSENRERGMCEACWKKKNR